MEDPIDDLWDELHPPRPHEIRPLPEGARVDPILEIDDLALAPAAHLVLAWSWADLGKAIDRLRAKTPPRATVDKLTSHLPCLIYGDDYWGNIQKGLEDLLGSDRQAFIGTMNTYVIDCFYFTSAEDAWSRILFVATTSARLYRMSEDMADRFYRGYETRVCHVSEILMTDGIW